MFESDWKLYLTHGPADAQTRLYFYRVRGVDQIELAQFDQELKCWETKSITHGEEWSPSIILPPWFTEVIKKHFIESEKRQVGESEAELKATKYHLEDMRSIAMSVHKNNIQVLEFLSKIAVQNKD